MSKILVTPRSLTKAGHPALDRLTNAGYEVVFCTPGVQPTEEELKNLLTDCVGYLAGVEPVSKEILNAATKLKVISRNGVGIDNVDLDAAEKLNIKVCKTEGANSRGVVELALTLIFSLLRSIPYSDKGMKNNEWNRRKGQEVYGKTLGLVGCGRIGKELALLALNLNMKVIAYDPFEAFFTPDENFKYVSMDEIWTNSDIISLHCPPAKNGDYLINKQTISKMKKGMYLVNTARAALIDEDAIIEALDEGQITGFATDVFNNEPPLDNKITSHDKIIATPHIGGFTNESIDRATDKAVENLLSHL